MPVDRDDELKSILELQTVAVVGCSRHRGKAAHEIPRYLQAQGYTIVPVNPHADRILGTRAYDSLAEIGQAVEIDIVDVFRPSDEVAGIVDAALSRDDVDTIWLQLGIHDDTAVARAERAGIRVVQDRCMKPEHRRLLGPES